MSYVNAFLSVDAWALAQATQIQVLQQSVGALLLCVQEFSANQQDIAKVCTPHSMTWLTAMYMFTN